MSSATLMITSRIQVVSAQLLSLLTLLSVLRADVARAEDDVKEAMEELEDIVASM